MFNLINNSLKGILQLPQSQIFFYSIRAKVDI